MTTHTTLRLFIHVEELSMKVAMEALLPRLLSRHVLATVIDHTSKQALLKNLPNRMKGYAKWADPSSRILVLVDQDDQDCRQIKGRLEKAAISAGLSTKTSPDHASRFKVVNRIVVKELEAWFLGDVTALADAFPGIPSTLGQKARFRDPDAVSGKTCEALLNVLKDAGHYAGSRRLPKVDVARRVAPFMNLTNNRSRSFEAFRTGLDALLA